MDNLAEYIKLAEDKWMPSIYAFLHSLYNGIHLPSHDVNHHVRVWSYAKELLSHIYTKAPASCSFIEQALVGCMFHDTGLIVDHSERHGHHSKVLFEQFLSKYPQLALPNVEDTLYAIEHHDDKSLKQSTGFGVGTSHSLVDLVSSADDLDAFGRIGVYRYIEIYALRGIPVENIPAMVIPNLSNRFENFCCRFSNFPTLVEIHRDRYLETKRFFEEAGNQSTQDFIFSSDEFKIVNNMVDVLVNRQMDIKSAIVMGIMSGLSAGQVGYYMGLKEELGL